MGIGKKIIGYKATLVIHDVMGLRSSKLSSDEGKIVLKEEIESMMIFDEIICHNEKMLECFKECFSSSKYKVLGPFDYLYEGNPVEYKKKLPWTIIVAGNLVQEKSGYLYNLPELTSAVFELYGNGYSQKISNSKNIIYNGGFPENELIKHLQGHFGLVWDGNSCETNEGIYGRYLRYNNPHKFSLYLAAGIPIIIWSESALVDCVKENNLGISISSLYELDDVLEKMTFSKYSEMRESVLKYREEIIKGGHLKRILTSLS